MAPGLILAVRWVGLENKVERGISGSFCSAIARVAMATIRIHVLTDRDRFMSGALRPSGFIGRRERELVIPAGS